MGTPFVSLASGSFGLLALRPIRSSSIREDLKGQRVAIVGLGASGRAAARLALARGASVLAVDRDEQLIPLEDDPQFVEHADFQTILGHFDDKLLADADRVIVSPGVPITEHGLSTLLHSKRQVMSELDFAAEVLPQNVKVLAVTGTNGKSTVSSFAGQMLCQLGFKTFVGGNLGKPLSEAALICLQACSLEDMFQVAVVEVSSYQMEIPPKQFSSSVAVILNLTPDHLERHKTMLNYAAMKCRIFSHMKHSKLAVLPVGNQYLIEAFGKCQADQSVAWIGDSPGIKLEIERKAASLSIPTTRLAANLELGALKAIGIHNYSNAAVAAFSVLGLDVGIDTDSINSTVETLRLLPHRMQVVCTDAHGITWVDDSKATNVESTYTGLAGLSEHKAVVLLGGLAKALKDRESSGFELLIEVLRHHRGVVTFGSSGAMIHKTLCDGGLDIPCVRATNLSEAVDCARNMAKYGDTILLSPGCASFDEFRNFEHRGKVFQELAES